MNHAVISQDKATYPEKYQFSDFLVSASAPPRFGFFQLKKVDFCVAKWHSRCVISVPTPLHCCYINCLRLSSRYMYLQRDITLPDGWRHSILIPTAFRSILFLSAAAEFWQSDSDLCTIYLEMKHECYIQALFLGFDRFKWTIKTITNHSVRLFIELY